MTCFTSGIIFITDLLLFIIAITSYQFDTSPCSLLIPSLLLESGINSSDVTRCGNHNFSNIISFSQCHSKSGSFISCTSPILIQRIDSKHEINLTTTQETIFNNPSIPPKESLVECIKRDRKKGICTRMFHHMVYEIIYEISEKLNNRTVVSIGFNDISSVSLVHCNSLNKENLFCTLGNQTETVITKPSKALMELLRNYILYGGEKIITSLSIFETIFQLEYRIDLLEPPISDYITFNISTAGLISYFIFSGFPLLENIRIKDIPLHHLPPDLFLENTKLKSCIMTNIMLEKIPSELFNSAVELATVDLRNNRLQTVPENLFQNNILLRNLFLAQNRLRYLPTKFLSNNHNLSTLDLSHNQLQDLQLLLLTDPPETTYKNFTAIRPVPKSFKTRFQWWLNDKNKQQKIYTTIKTNALAKIDISYNELHKIPDGIFDGSITLTIFRAHHNSYIRNLMGSHSFYGLEEFSMSDCGITNIDEDFFAKTFENEPFFITKIDLNRNQLHFLHPRTFWGCYLLEILFLNKNKLTKLDGDLFRDLIKLRHLDVSGNMLTEFKPEAFNLPNIVYLDFSWNRIHSFDPYQMTSLFESGSGIIKRIDFSHNCLTTKRVILPTMKINRPLFLQYVSLEYKPFMVNNSRWKDRYNFQIGESGVNLTSGFKVSKQNDQPLTLQIRIGPVEKGTILCPNPFKQLCTYIPHSCRIINNITWSLIDEYMNLTQCREWINDDYYSAADAVACPFTATCSKNYYRSTLYSVAEYYKKNISFTCPIINSCPLPCSCYQEVIENEVVVECNYKGLMQLPKYIPSNTAILYFNHNKLQTLHDFKFSIWSNLTRLYLENNSIISISKEFLPSKLKLISLRNNQLKSIDKDSLSMFDDIEFYLSGNPWLCDCNAVFLKAKLNSLNKISDAKSLFCASLNTSIIDTANDILCPTKLRVSLNLSLALCLGIILPIVVASLIVLYYKNKQLLKAYIFTRFPALFTIFDSSSDVDSDKKFDAFVSYSSSDRDIVMEMLEELENKEPRFSLCIHERDWLPGNPISINIAKSVCLSRRVVIILSMDFLQSIWFPVELHTVYHQMIQDKVNRAIIVVRGKIPPINELDSYLQILLKTKTYLVWGEHWFWEKLRYALFQRHHKKESLGNKGPTGDFIERIEADILNSRAMKSKEGIDCSINEIIV